MKTGAKGKGHACAAQSQAYAFSLGKKCQVTAFQTHLDAPTRGEPPLAVGGHPGSTAAPAPLRGEPGAGAGGQEGDPAGQPPAAGRCRAGAGRAGSPQPLPAAASIAGRGRRCQTPPGGRGSSQPGPLRGEPARPPHASEGTKRGQGGGAERRGSRRSAAAVLAAKLTSSYRGLRAAPLPLPGRGAPRALVALCSRGSFPRSLPFLSLALPVLAR